MTFRQVGGLRSFDRAPALLCVALRRDPDELRLPVQLLVCVGEFEVQRQREKTAAKRPLTQVQIFTDVVASNLADASGERMHSTESGVTSECGRLNQKAVLRC